MKEKKETEIQLGRVFTIKGILFVGTLGGVLVAVFSSDPSTRQYGIWGAAFCGGFLFTLVR